MHLADWLRNALRGEAMEYARGNLAFARYWRVRKRLADIPTPDLDPICDAAEDAWRLYCQGKVTLLQRRISPDVFAYIAVKL